MTKALVVFSGGQDSTTCLGWALENYEQIKCVTFDYGQRHKVEIQAAQDVIQFFESKTGVDIEDEVIKLGDNFFAGNSPLSNKSEPLETYKNHSEMEKIIGDRIEKTFVPMRNAVFLMIAANRMVVSGASVLVTGVCQEDNANYPDCREDFIFKAENLINSALGDGNYYHIETPLMWKSKAETVQLAIDLPHTYAALQYSHTAYDGAFPPVGGDHASVLRAHGFEQAGKPDPLILRAVSMGLMKMPTTENYKNAMEAMAQLELI